MIDDWDDEVRFRRYLRVEHGVIPYREMRAWRGRFWIALALNFVFVVLLLSMLGGCR